MGNGNRQSMPSSYMVQGVRVTIYATSLRRLRIGKDSLTVPRATSPALMQGTRRTMAGLSLRQAAQQAGTSKSTILRAIQNGRLSATRTDDGGYSIDPAELFRVYTPKTSGDRIGDATGPQRTTDQPAGQDAPSSDTVNATELRIANARLEAELAALKALLEAERKRGDELRDDRDGWRSQAERLVLSGPQQQERRGWWPFRRAG